MPRYSLAAVPLIQNTQIILDWDDTLFPTAYTLLKMSHDSDKVNLNLVAKSDWKRLQELNNLVLYILFMFIELVGANNLVIVTNAKYEWFHQSCSLYRDLYAQVHKFCTTRITVISAHDDYNHKKSCAMMDVMNRKPEIQKVVCIGDSIEEYDAIHSVCEVLKITRRRTLNYYRFKLLETPSLNAMITQWTAIKALDYYSISKEKQNRSHQFK